MSNFSAVDVLRREALDLAASKEASAKRVLELEQTLSVEDKKLTAHREPVERSFASRCRQIRFKTEPSKVVSNLQDGAHAVFEEAELLARVTVVDALRSDALSSKDASNHCVAAHGRHISDLRDQMANIMQAGREFMCPRSWLPMNETNPYGRRSGSL